MTQPVTLRYSPKFHGVIVASQLAQSGRSVAIECPAEHKAELQRKVLEYNRGAWPIALRVVVT